MLLILTGDIEIGKTTWLARAVDELTAAHVRCDGVIAPGIWMRKEDGTLDKLGIDNLLLPQKKRIPFARRADLAKAEGAFDADAQSAKAQLKWHISDEAIACVNRHFEALMRADRPGKGATATQEKSHGKTAHNNAEDAGGPETKRLLVIDELGQLELLHGKGLTSAVRMLEAGPRETYEHAVLIVRDKFGLAEKAERRFSDAWGGSARIAPTDEAWRRWIGPMAHTRHNREER